MILYKNRIKSVWAAAIFVMMTSICCLSQPAGSGFESITSKNLMESVNILCSKELDGRLPGSIGYDKAAQFAAIKFEEAGLLPAGEQNYFQCLNVEFNQIDSPVVFKVINQKEENTYRIGKDFVFRGFTGAGEITLPVAFCGYGISRPDLDYDDYKNIDVEDKIVMVFKQNPPWKIKDSAWGNEYPREKSTIAYKHGAKGILFVSRPNDTKPQPLIGSVMHGDGEQILDFPQLQISIEAADKILLGTGKVLSEYQSTIDEAQKPNSLITKSEAKIVVNTIYKEYAQTMNVVGLLEGNDPVMKDEYLIIGAHLDHVGSQAGLLYPGANDNASGSAAVIQLAQAFATNGEKNKRSILFVLFASEEQGLFGSKYFVENMNINHEKVVAMLNLDCIGYGDSIQVGNGKSSPELWNLAKEIDQKNFNLMIEETWSGGGADLTPFYDKGIPGLYFVSKYSYDHLHQPSDTPETLSPSLYENIVKLVYLTAKELVNEELKTETIQKN